MSPARLFAPPPLSQLGKNPRKSVADREQEIVVRITRSRPPLGVFAVQRPDDLSIRVSSTTVDQVRIVVMLPRRRRRLALHALELGQLRIGQRIEVRHPIGPRHFPTSRSR